MSSKTYYSTPHGTLTSNGQGGTIFDPTKKSLTEEEKLSNENSKLKTQILELEKELALLRKILDE